VHKKSRSTTFKELHVPVIDANMSISGAFRSVSSAQAANETTEKHKNPAATRRQKMRMKVTPKSKMQVKL
jgi:hypothetical protein